jgi:hypothetical protein
MAYNKNLQRPRLSRLSTNIKNIGKMKKKSRGIERRVRFPYALPFESIKHEPAIATPSGKC